MQIIRINQGRIVPWQFRTLVVIVVFGTIFYAMSQLSEIIAIAISMVISFLVPLVWSAYLILEINLTERTISKITWVMGERKRETENFKGIEKVYINTGKISQTMTSYGGKVHHRKTKHYIAFLKTEEGKKYFLISSENEETLLKKLEPVMKKLDCRLDKNY